MEQSMCASLSPHPPLVQWAFASREDLYAGSKGLLLYCFYIFSPWRVRSSQGIISVVWMWVREPEPVAEMFLCRVEHNAEYGKELSIKSLLYSPCQGYFHSINEVLERPFVVEKE